MAEAGIPGFEWAIARKNLVSWLSIPLVGASVASVLLSIIILPYWWLAVQWSGEIMPNSSVHFTFVTTTFLLALIVIDSVFIIRYYQILRRRELLEKARAIKISEENYRSLIDLAPFPVVITRLSDSTIIMINQRTAKLFSIDPSTVVGEEVQNFYANPDDRVEVLHTLRDQGYLDNFEVRILSQGKKVWTSLSAAIIQYMDEPALFVAFVDISLRKDLEEAMRKSEELYRSVVTASPDAIAISDLNGVITMVSPAAVLMFGGRSPDDFIGHNVMEYIHPDDAPLAQKNMAFLISGGKLHIRQYRGQRLDKTYFPYEIHSELTYDDQANPAGIVYVIRDITLRVEAEEALRENEERFITIFQEVPDPLLILDESGIVREINLTGEIRLQVPRDRILGTPFSFFELFPEDEKGNPLMFILGQNTGETLQTRMHLPDGTQRYVIIRTRRITLRRAPAILLMIQDIDEIKRAQNALAQANNQINLLNSITRHDILNRVTVVMSYCQFLMEDITDEVAYTRLSYILESGKDIRHLIDFTREYQDLGIKKPVWQRFDLIFQKPSIQNLLEGITVKLPEIAVEISVDPMLEKVVYNLVENSTRHGQCVTEITVSYQKHDDDLLIRYSDNGVGIPLEEKKLIFKKGHGKNTGLGLFLIREILNITGISITETGLPGEGVLFEILVPAGSFRVAE